MVSRRVVAVVLNAFGSLPRATSGRYNLTFLGWDCTDDDDDDENEVLALTMMTTTSSSTPKSGDDEHSDDGGSIGH